MWSVVADTEKWQEGYWFGGRGGQAWGMARKLRLETAGGIYHVLNRGNYRAAMFRSEQAKAAFLECLGQACGRTGWQVHAWCIMSNHYHLAIESPQANHRH